MSDCKTLLTFEKTIDFSGQQSGQHILHINRNLIADGLFRSLPPVELLTFFLLLAFMDEDKTVTINIESLTEYLAADEDRVYTALGYLESKELIEVEDNPLCIKRNELKIRIKNLPEPIRKTKEKPAARNPESLTGPEEENYFRAVTRQNTVSKEELARALTALFYTEQMNERMVEKLREDIADWMERFETRVIQELIRRIRKKQKQSPGISTFDYARGIVQDWIENDITTYEQLQKADRIHREVHELARECGLSYPLMPYQKEILARWMEKNSKDDFALSIEVCKLAIQKASSRRRNPSLEYIEKYYIKPLKEAKVKTPEEAGKLLEKKRSFKSNNTNNSNKSSHKKKYKWEDFFWDFEKYKEK